MKQDKRGSVTTIEPKIREKFVDMDDNFEENMYRITFTCPSRDFPHIEEYIRGYGDVDKRERRI